MEDGQVGTHTALLLPDILLRIFSQLGPRDFECGLRVCRAWRAALSSRVAWLGVPVHVAEGSALILGDFGSRTTRSLSQAFVQFSNASNLALLVTSGHQAQPGDNDAPGLALADREALLPLLQQLLCRATTLDLEQGLYPSRNIPHGSLRQPHGLQQQHPRQQQTDLLDCLQALCSRAGQPLDCLQRLSVRGRGWRLAPSLSSLADLLPCITHLDMAPGPEQYADGCGCSCEVDVADGAMAAGAGVSSHGDHSFCRQYRYAWGPSRNGGIQRGRRWAAGAAPHGATQPPAAATGASEAPSLTLPAAQALFRSLPTHLQHLGAVLSIGDQDHMAAWAAVLRSLPAGLKSLRLLGPLCHAPDLAAAVAGWSSQLPQLRSLELEVAECSHSHPDLEGQLYDDPDGWTSKCWEGVLPGLTQLRALTLTADVVSEGLCEDARSITQLARLRLHQTGWSGMCSASGQAASLTGLRDLALTLGDCAELQELSSLRQLTRLELELRGLEEYGSRSNPSGLLGLVTDGLTALRHLRLSCRTASVDPHHLGALAESCPELRILEVRAPFRPTAATAAEAADQQSFSSLPPRVCALELDNTTDRALASGAVSPVVRLSGLPSDLTSLSLRGLTLELSTEALCEVGAADGPCRAFARGLEVVELYRCITRCAGLRQLLGNRLRSLVLTGSAVVPFEEAASGTRGCDWMFEVLGHCRDLRELRIWGCRFTLKPCHDGTLRALVAAHPRLRAVELNVTAATMEGLAVFSQLEELFSLGVAVYGHECAGALGDALAVLKDLRQVLVVFPSAGLSFAASCVHDHLVRSLSGAIVHFRSQQFGD